jgi:hypothetical protein
VLERDGVRLGEIGDGPGQSLVVPNPSVLVHEDRATAEACVEPGPVHVRDITDKADIENDGQIETLRERVTGAPPISDEAKA